MKFIVDEMPNYEMSCPLYKYDDEIKERVCSLDGEGCDLKYRPANVHYIGCRWLREQDV